MLRPGNVAVRDIVTAGTGTIEGVTVTPLLNEEIQEGDWYIAGRNTGPHLFTCKRNDKLNGWIMPVELGYPFDTYECVKVTVSFD